MAKLSDIVIRTAEYRPCIVDGEKALFHRWLNFAYVVDASLMIGGHPGGQVADTFGLVELEYGTMRRVAPTSIHFCDSSERFEKYCWPKAKKEDES